MKCPNYLSISTYNITMVCGFQLVHLLSLRRYWPCQFIKLYGIFLFSLENYLQCNLCYYQYVILNVINKKKIILNLYSTTILDHKCPSDVRALDDDVIKFWPSTCQLLFLASSYVLFILVVGFQLPFFRKQLSKLIDSTKNRQVQSNI